jgi:hypothetical protein
MMFTDWTWAQWFIAAYLATNAAGGVFKEGKLHANGQEAYLAVVGVVMTLALYTFTAYALHVGGFW